jgi:hypothetical protein
LKGLSLTASHWPGEPSRGKVESQVLFCPNIHIHTALFFAHLLRWPSFFSKKHIPEEWTTSELAMHLYRKFHARGGVRRVYATADKNWDRQGWARGMVQWADSPSEPSGWSLGWLIMV